MRLKKASSTPNSRHNEQNFPASNANIENTISIVGLFKKRAAKIISFHDFIAFA
jgi:hypothetical protein